MWRSGSSLRHVDARRAFGRTGLAAAAGALALVLGSTIARSETQSPQTPVFRAGTETVPLYVTAIDQNGRLVTDLTRDDFQVYDNGRPQTITIFDAGLQPITVIVMLDMSGSMAGNIQTLRRAAVQLFTRLLPGDKARVGNFGDRISISPRFTNDQDELIRALYLDLQPGGPTPLWGAVNAAMAALSHLDGRRVVLVLSDGKDTGGSAFGSARTSVSLADVALRAQTEDYMVYAIGMRSRSGFGRSPAAAPWSGSPGGSGGTGGGYGSGRTRSTYGGDEPDPGLRELAFASGGGYFELVGTDNLAEAFGSVAEELHRQYLIGYAAPENDGKLHEVAVRSRVPGLTIRTRRSYLAKRGGL